jgi:hypothetical protein
MDWNEEYGIAACSIGRCTRTASDAQMQQRARRGCRFMSFVASADEARAYDANAVTGASDGYLALVDVTGSAAKLAAYSMRGFMPAICVPDA